MASVVICDRCGERMEKLSERDACQYKVIWDHKRLDLCPKCKEALGKFLKMDDSSRESRRDTSKITIRFADESVARFFVDSIANIADSWGGVGLNDITNELDRLLYTDKVELQPDWKMINSAAWRRDTINDGMSLVKVATPVGKFVYEVRFPSPDIHG